MKTESVRACLSQKWGSLGADLSQKGGLLELTQLEKGGLRELTQLKKGDLLRDTSLYYPSTDVPPLPMVVFGMLVYSYTNFLVVKASTFGGELIKSSLLTHKSEWQTKWIGCTQPCDT